MSWLVAKAMPTTVGEREVSPGENASFELKVARLPTGGWLSLPVAVVNGAKGGPTIWLSGAVHGEIQPCKALKIVHHGSYEHLGNAWSTAHSHTRSTSDTPIFCSVHPTHCASWVVTYQ